jgi:hypothetical protein
VTKTTDPVAVAAVTIFGEGEVYLILRQQGAELGESGTTEDVLFSGRFKATARE